MPSTRALQRHLQQLKALRGKGTRAPQRLVELKRWQSDRLARTYEDLAREPRYRAATRFFLDDLYGTKDFSGRDEAMMRIARNRAQWENKGRQTRRNQVSLR